MDGDAGCGCGPPTGLLCCAPVSITRAHARKCVGVLAPRGDAHMHTAGLGHRCGARTTIGSPQKHWHPAAVSFACQWHHPSRVAYRQVWRMIITQSALSRYYKAPVPVPGPQQFLSTIQIPFKYISASCSCSP